MSVAFHYPLQEYRRFLVSLRHHYSGAIVVFADPSVNGKSRVLGMCRALGVQVVTAVRMPRIVFDRFAPFAAVCEMLGPRALCLATDFRDSFFQADPFASLDQRGAFDLVLAQEYAGQRLGECPYNTVWIRECYGEEELKRLAALPIVCAGSLLGTPRGFSRLSDRMSLRPDCNDQGTSLRRYLYPQPCTSLQVF
jgi:hypothetical protein